MARGGMIVIAVVAIGAVPGSAPARAEDVIREALKAGWSAYTRQDFDQAEAQYRAALQEADRRGERGSVRILCLNCLADTYLARRQAGEAEPLYERALALAENEPQADPLQLASLRRGLLYAHYLQGRLDEASRTAGGR